MSKEYIEKEAAIRNVCKGCGLFDTDNCICTGSVRCDEYDAILDTPPADVKPVVKGEWIDCAVKLDLRSNHHDYKCPKCGYPADYFICGSEDWWCAYEPNFCPHCGAYMRKEANDER